MQLESITLQFSDEGPVDTSQLADFLFLFRGAYAAGLEVAERLGSESPEDLARGIREHVNELTLDELNALFTKDLGKHRLLPQRIGHESPIHVVVFGVLPVLLAAVILSGGSLKALTCEVKLNPIGDGIKKLRDALSHRTKVALRFGAQVRRIKLSRAEYQELLKHKEEDRTHGGFQRFLVGLRYRVNARTRELELSQSDIDKIIRHARQHKKGGWQKSIRRIFGRHFNL